MSYQKNGQGVDFIKGALLGGILGGITGLLTAPKSGKELRDDILESYNTLNDKTHEFTDNIRESGKRLSSVFSQDEDHQNVSFLTGSAAGAVIGAVAALLLAPKSGRKLREDLGDKYDEIRQKAKKFSTHIGDQGHQAMENLEDWKDTLGTLVNKLTHAKGKHSGAHHSRVEEIVDWASLGIRLLQQMQSRR